MHGYNVHVNIMWEMLRRLWHSNVWQTYLKDQKKAPGTDNGKLHSFAFGSLNEIYQFNNSSATVLQEWCYAWAYCCSSQSGGCDPLEGSWLHFRGVAKARRHLSGPGCCQVEMGNLGCNSHFPASLTEHNGIYFQADMAELWHPSYVFCVWFHFWQYHHYQVDDITSGGSLIDCHSQRRPQAEMFENHGLYVAQC